MNSHEDMSGLDQDSEFDSEEEDAEFLMYQQLYFEPNTDITEADVQRRLPTQGRHDGKSVFEPHDKHILQHSGCQLNTVQNSKRLPELKNKASSHTLSTAASDIHEDQNPQIQDNIYIDTLESAELTLTDFNVEISVKNTHDPSTVQQSELHVSTGHEACAGAPAMRRKAVPARSVRERLSSTCSDGSIPGSVPLDALYCNLVTSEEEEEEDINRMLLKDLETNNEKRKNEKAKANSNKRKRRKSSCSEGAPEDSRCSHLITAASKNAVSHGHVQEGAEDSHSDADIFILPPPEQRKHEILILNSSSDSEGGEGNRAGTYKKMIRKNKYQKTEKSLSSPRKASNKDGKLKAVQQVSVRGRKKGCDLAAGSESDSNDVDMPEATKGTDLILNIDKSLSGWVRTITKEPNTPKKTKSVMKKPGQNSRPSVDFTKGRADTTTAPSCPKWTQGMTNFYDSDVSDDLYVSEVHLQQSGSRADWHLIAADYQLNFQRRRYYNVTDRCKLCKQEGHTIKNCPRVPTCHLCSGTDHSCRGDCPENCCFKCGGEHHFVCPVADPWSSKCNLCGFPGHPKKLCPDLWRRFHLTTSGLVAQSPTECPTRPPGQRYCYSCGKRGHYGHDCPIRFQNRSYSQVPQSVVSYCSPVTIADDGYFVVNLDEAQSTEENVTTISIKPKDVGRIIGKKGTVVKSVINESGATVRVIDEGQPQVQVFGSAEARLKAKKMIELLLGRKNYLEAAEHLKNNNTNTCSVAMTSGTSGISSVAMTSGTSGITFLTLDAGDSNNSHQKSWCENFLVRLGKQKVCIVRRLYKVLKVMRSRNDNINNSIAKLKSFMKQKKFDPSAKPSQSVKRHFSRIAMKVVGSEKYGECSILHGNIAALMHEVQFYPDSFIPREICYQITETLKPFHNPSMDNLTQIMPYAEWYAHKYQKKGATKKKLCKKAKSKEGKNENATSNENVNNTMSKESKKKMRKQKFKAMNVKTKAMKTKAVNTKAVNTKAVKTKAVKTKAVKTKAMKTKAVNTKAVNTKAVNTKAVNTKAMKTKAMKTKAKKTKAMKTKAKKKKAVKAKNQCTNQGKTASVGGTKKTKSRKNWKD